ncbi:unnamed protein product [Nesidiocoris tenuis]|uniref:Uncharacterized protein n=1 Tax=Nesidiocoris tenuis TaxID=355587 RepID=A0A6H5G1I2_9HEMI|nr:unnamed protein product [Nesidiocoris tenuis]
MADLFTFFRGLIGKHHDLYSTNTAVGNLLEASKHAQVVQVVLLTLGGFVEWVSMVHIMAEDGKMLQYLCLLLNNEPFQDGAAECLLQIVSRKGKADERRPLLVLFSEGAMRCIFSAADTSVNKNYQFLKKLTQVKIVLSCCCYLAEMPNLRLPLILQVTCSFELQVLTGLGSQLCSLWSKETESRPPNFEMYLEAIVTFTRHASLSLVYYANSLWLQLMKHDQISKDEVFLSFVPKWVDAAGPKILKVLFPSSKSLVEPNTPESYAVLDYDAEDEYNGFFHRYRVELLDTFKQATLVAPLVTYTYVERWLEAQIRKTMASNSSEPCTLSSVLYREWDALSLALDAVLSKLVMAKERPDVLSGLRLLDLCLAFEPTDPLILSAMLSCISALFVFLSMAPPETTAVYLPRVLDKIFATLVFTVPGEPKNQRSRGVKNLRRHAVSLMVKIAQKYPLLLLPVFSRIHSTVASLQSKAHVLSSMEALCLQEALLLISNHLCDYEKESRFVGEVVTPITMPWLLLTTTAFSSTADFMAYIGLNKPPVEPGSDDTNGQNRSQISRCLGVLLAVVKRCVWPSDPELAVRGGFLVCTTPAGHPIYRNPAAPHVIPLFPGLLALCQVLHGLTSPQALALLSEEMLEDMLNRTMTREYVDVLKATLYGVIDVEDAEKPPQNNDAVSELGAKVLQCEQTCQAVTICLLRYPQDLIPNMSVKEGAIIARKIEISTSLGAMLLMPWEHIHGDVSKINCFHANRLHGDVSRSFRLHLNRMPETSPEVLIAMATKSIQAFLEAIAIGNRIHGNVLRSNRFHAIGTHSCVSREKDSVATESVQAVPEAAISMTTK